MCCIAWATATSWCWPTRTFRANRWGSASCARTGCASPRWLDAFLPLLVLDDYVETPVLMMAPVPGDDLDPAVERSFRAAIDRHAPHTASVARLERFAFYERAKGAYAVVMTGETAKYGNILLCKGVTPVPD